MNDKAANGTLNRRCFIKKLGAGAAVLAVAANTSSLSTRASVPKKKIQYGMLIDTRRCIGCHACSVACKSEFNVPVGFTRSWVEYVEKGNYPHVSRSFLPRLCNHCRHPKCVDVCPTGATTKRPEDGIVVVDPDICIGCKYCVQACPYDARFMNPVTGAADKCDFCLHRVSLGLKPVCVETCIGRARIFGDLNDPKSEISRALASNPVSVLRPGMGTEPNVYYIAADHSDEHELRRGRGHIRVTTHRKVKKRR